MAVSSQVAVGPYQWSAAWGIHHAGGMESEVAPAEIVKEISSKL
jgi:hypothetical protein